MPAKRRPAPVPQLIAIGRRLRLARELRKYSRKMVYEKGGPHAYTLWLYENGQMNPSALVLVALGAIYAREVGWFFEGVQHELYPKGDDATRT